MKTLIATAMLAFAGNAVLAQDVSYNFDPNADFSKYKTYRWMEHPKSLDIDDITKQQLKKGFEPALAAKGLTLKDSADADLTIVYQLAVNQEKEMTTMDMGGYGYGPGWRGGWYGGMGGIATTTTSTINIGTVVLDMYETSSKHLAWRGAASKTIDPKAKPEKREKNISKAATKMLKNYPPKKKS
jgi:hypothetical protein